MDFQKGELLCLTQTKMLSSFIRRSLEQGNLPVADELFADNYSHHDSSTPELGEVLRAKKRERLSSHSIPDVRLTVEDIIAEGETVTARWSCKGTHKGDSEVLRQRESNHISGIACPRYEWQDGEVGSTGTL